MYAMAAGAFARDRSLSAVEVRRSPLGGPRTVVDVVFTHRDRKTDAAERSFVRVDVSERFSFLLTRLQPYVGR